MSLTTESLGTKRKVFWTIFMALGAVAVADFSLPLWWALADHSPVRHLWALLFRLTKPKARHSLQMSSPSDAPRR